jgi:prolyl-tRNA synthetase
LPPKVAPIQVVIVPITKNSVVLKTYNTTSNSIDNNNNNNNNKENEVEKRVLTDDEKVLQLSSTIEKELKKFKIRTKIDSRVNMRPGAKFFEWERKGVPIRIELGARDVNNNVITIAIRYNGIKETINIENMDN